MMRRKPIHHTRRPSALSASTHSTKSTPLSPTAQIFVPRTAQFPGTLLLSDYPEPVTLLPQSSATTPTSPMVSKRKRAQRATSWTVHTDIKVHKDGTSRKEFQTKIKVLGNCTTKTAFEKNFGRYANSMRRDVALRVFRSDVEPIWEDPANIGNGCGKWTIVLPNEATSRKAFRHVLTELMGDALKGVNGVITMCKRSTHVLLLWTQAHEQSTNRENDPYAVKSLVARISKAVRVPLKAIFKAHPTSSKPAKSIKENRQVAEESDYASSTSGTSSPARSESPPRSPGLLSKAEQGGTRDRKSVV